MEAIKNLQKITLAFIYDKSPILDLICNDLIVSGIEVLFRSENIKEGLSQLYALQAPPNICIIELDFYDKNVLVELQELRIKYPNIKLIAHSDIDNEKVGKTLLDIGFVGYLLIGSDADDFKKAIDKTVNSSFSYKNLKMKK
ncbi:response regulator transcription factor [Flavobacterium aquidurense]|uniref:DNA-binding NarL/FixJ family response regulator n=2 Tax=Flavobacterium TaxID=237 RepID=A0A7W7IW38_9FLAO|nr:MULTISPECIES: response regulator transcription factor [Flavobacterium]MBB4801669.1 DNA-binding NarL/FixJ family response regulator [Flavobacterium nitrogenifigens]MBB6386627.1 DNA-binding NarL/FixJ family response regulator [Flavobacterium notoginsengisoli]